jgi:hypothetical protein
MISFVAFYVDLPENTAEKVNKPLPALAEQPLEMLRVMFASVDHFHPGARKVVLTDHTTDFSSFPDLHISRGLVDPFRLMESRMEAWLNFLAQADSHVIFLDSDIVLQADLTPIFDQDFDLALTYRLQEQWPINAGVQLFHMAHLDRGRAFIRDCLRLYRSKYQSDGFWGGDQDVLREMVKGADVSRTDNFIFNEKGYNTLMLPCSIFNFSTENTFMDGYYPKAKVLHFKGPRKVYQDSYWRRYLAKTVRTSEEI